MKQIIIRLKRFHANQTGQAMAETAITILLFLMLILGIMQLSLMFNAKLMVKYAAYCAARSAIVYSADMDRAKRAAQIACTALENRSFYNYSNVDVKVEIDSPMKRFMSGFATRIIFLISSIRFLLL